MTLSNRRSRCAVWLVAASLAVGTLGVVSRPAHAGAAGSDVTSVRESVEYLTGRYNIDSAEALRRLDLQRAAGPLAERLAIEHPDTYAGMWLDQRAGRLVVRGTVPSLLRGTVLATLAPASVRFESAAHSLRVLRAAASTLTAANPDRIAYATVDESTGQVVARAKDGAADPALDSVPSGTVRIQRPVADLRLVRAACSIPACDPPMRGGLGVAIYSPDIVYHGSCTIGFGVVGSNGWDYTLTAGHCVAGAGHYTYHNGHFVGYERSGFNNYSYPLDYAIMPYRVDAVNEHAHWLPPGQAGNLVYTACVNGNHGCASRPDNRIVGMHSFDAIQRGWVACASGSISRTECGEVVEKNAGIRMNIRRVPGDSGGPLFSQIDNRAYGILTYSTDIAISDYSPLSKIFDNARAQTGLSFSVRTW